MLPMNPQLVDNARRTLEAESARIRIELSEEVEHPRVAHGAQTAAATEVSESQRGQQLRQREELHLGLIEGALRRIDAGGFGVCQACGKTIALERLEALPWAQDCLDCHAKKRR
jgi:RNA polymerase-binding protein DksA